MTIIDSSVLIALAIKNDSQHEKAIQVLSEVADSAQVPNAVLVEAAGVLWEMLQDAEFLGQWCQQVSERFQIVCEQPEVIQHSIERYFRQADRFSLVDCQLIEWNKSLGFDVLSFDDAVNRELQRA